MKTIPFFERQYVWGVGFWWAGTEAQQENLLYHVRYRDRR